MLPNSINSDDGSEVRVSANRPKVTKRRHRRRHHHHHHYHRRRRGRNEMESCLARFGNRWLMDRRNTVVGMRRYFSEVCQSVMP